MEINNIEQSLKAAFQDPEIIKEIFSKDGTSEENTTCLSDEQLTQLIDNKLPENELDSIFGHLVFCESCMELFLTAYEVVKPSSVTIKKKIESKIEAYTKKLKRFTFMIKMLPDRIIPMVLDSGLIPTQAMMPATVRGTTTNDKTNLIKLSKEIEPFLLEFDIERINDNRVNIQIYVQDIQSKKPVNNIRISLFRNEREEGSETTRNEGLINFEVEADRYLIILSEKGSEICKFDVSFDRNTE